MNIVLATATDEAKSWNVGSFPPLGLLYVAGSVKPLPGVRVTVVDTYGEGLNLDRSVERILAAEPDMLGVTVTSQTFMGAWRLAARVKAARPGVTTIFGGIHPSLFDSLLLKEMPELDLIFRGEAEEGFPELCRRLLGAEDIAGTPGISYRANGKVVRGELQRIQDLDTLPFPDRSLLDSKMYGSQWYGFKLPEIPALTTMSSSRGCPYHCIFCSCTKMFGNRLRTRSAENVFGELQQLAGEGFKVALFWDDNFTADVQRVDRLCHLILDHHLKMNFACAGTLHTLPDETLKLMHQAGFDLFFLGAESGSDAQLRRYRKPTTSQKLAHDISRAKKAHLFVIASFITGHPEETDADHEATKELVRKVRPQMADVNPLMVHPGSLLWEQINGPGIPETLEKSWARRISHFPGQLKTETIKWRERDFRQTFQQTWLEWRRLLDILDLVVYNKSFRFFIKSALKNPKILLQLIFGGAPRT